MQQETAGSDRASDDGCGDVTERLTRFITNELIFGREVDLHQVDSLLEEGIVDSTGILELVDFLESSFAITVHDHDIVRENMDSLVALVSFVERQRARTAEAAR